MSGQQLVADELKGQVPALLEGAAVVAIVPATELKGWAAEMAWSVARAAAAAGRRTVLVDCFVNQPTLHGAEGSANDEGLVDAFEYGSSLNRIVQPQHESDLFFIPAGTYQADAETVLQNPRWKRLSAGFRHEAALLLLYMAADHLLATPAELDGVVVLAPQGQATAVSEIPALADAVARGLPLLAVVAESPEKADEPARAPLFRSFDPPVSRSPEPHSRALAIGATALLVVVGAATALRLGGARLLKAPPAPAARVEAAPPLLAAPIASHPSPVTHHPSPITHHAVSPLPWTVPVGSVPDVASAFQLADAIEASGWKSIITPVDVAGRPRRYRVYAGPFATRARADSALFALADKGYGSRSSAPVSLPMSLAIGEPMPPARAGEARARLRRAGVPSFMLGNADGTYRLYAGAFLRKAPVKLLTSLLTPTGGAGQSVQRAGYVP